MNKNKILQYAAVFLLIIGIAYFWNKMAPGAIENDVKAQSTKTQSTKTQSGKDQSTKTKSTKTKSTKAPSAAPVIKLDGLDKVTSSKSMPSVIKEYEGFTVNFNPENKTPNYVAWILQGHETEGATARSNKFWTDRELEGCADTRDYSRSGYDRGHMCPAGEQKWSDLAMQHSFVMANICPQSHELNTGAWKTLEDKERVWAKRDSAIVIVAGPIYDSSDKETIGYNKVRVPSAFFKVLLAPYATPMRAIGFVYPNMKCDGNMASYAVSVDDVEKMTGFDFFSSLPDDIENDIEASVPFKDWNSNKKKKNYEYSER